MSPERTARESGAESGLAKKHREDHLGVALIQPGGFRYQPDEVAAALCFHECTWQLQQGWNRVELTSLAIGILQGIFYAQSHIWSFAVL